MNERIKALKEQAFDTIWDFSENAIGPSTHFIPEGFEEKFAELIVKECAHVALMSNGNNLHVFTLIKEHFGIEL